MAHPPLLAVNDRFVAVHGHGRQHCKEAGSGEPLILIHTNGASAWQYAEMFPFLLTRFHVLAWDMPGHGDSDPIQRHYSVEDYADALNGFMEALNLPSAHISGCSIGGSICVAFAARYPQRTRSTVIVETPFRTDSEWGANWAHVEANFGLPTQTEKQMGERVAKVDDARLARWNIDRNKAGARTMVDVMWAIRGFDVGVAAKAIHVPATILYGKRGPTIAGQERFKASAPHIPIQVMDDSGHFPMLDQPAAFAEILTAFVSRYATK